MLKHIRRVVAVALSLTLILTAAAVGVPIEAQAEMNIPDFRYIGAIDQILDSDEAQAVAEAIYYALATNQTSVDISRYKIPYNNENHLKLLGLYYEVSENYDVGIRAGKHLYASYYPDTNLITSLRIQYMDSNEDLAEKKQSSLDKMDAILSAVNENWNNYEKALYLHDYIVANYDYDVSLNIQTAGDMLDYGKAVCDGYASLYVMMLNRIGIPARKVTSTNLNHAWSLVNIDGSWYHVDPTFDDPADPETGVVSYYGYVGHDNFLKTNVEIKASGHNVNDFTYCCGASVDDDVSGTSFPNAFWDGSKSVIVPIFIDGDNTKPAWAVAKGERANQVTLTLCDIDDDYGKTYAEELYDDMSVEVWRDYTRDTGSSSSFYTYGVCSVIAFYDGVIFYTTGKSIRAVYNKKTYEISVSGIDEKEAIFGMKIEDGKLKYSVGRTPTAQSFDFQSAGDAAELANQVKNSMGTRTLICNMYDDSGSIVDTVTVDDCLYSTFNPTDYVAPENYFLKGVYKDSYEHQSVNDGYIITSYATLYGKIFKCRYIGNSVTLSNEIKMNLIFDADDECIKNTWMYIKIDNGNNNISSVGRDKKSFAKDNKNNYYTTISLTPKQLDANISIQLINHGSERTLIAQGITANAYLSELNGTEQELAESLISYGAFANAYFDSDNDTVSEEIAESVKAVTVSDEQAQTFKPATNGKTNLPEGLNYKCVTLVLEDTTTIRHYFTVDEGHSIGDYKFTVDGVEQTNIKSKTDDQGNTMYYIEKTGIKPTELADAVTITAIAQDAEEGKEPFSISCSPCTYACTVIQNKNNLFDESLVNLMKAFYNYYFEASKF